MSLLGVGASAGRPVVSQRRRGVGHGRGGPHATRRRSSATATGSTLTGRSADQQRRTARRAAPLGALPVGGVRALAGLVVGLLERAIPVTVPAIPDDLRHLGTSLPVRPARAAGPRPPARLAEGESGSARCWHGRGAGPWTSGGVSCGLLAENPPHGRSGRARARPERNPAGLGHYETISAVTSSTSGISHLSGPAAGCPSRTRRSGSCARRAGRCRSTATPGRARRCWRPARRRT